MNPDRESRTAEAGFSLMVLSLLPLRRTVVLPCPIGCSVINEAGGMAR